MPRLIAAGPMTALSLAAACAGMLGLAVSSTDRIIGETVASGLGSAERTMVQAPVAGSEAFWLSSHPTDDADLARIGAGPVGVGDRITIAAARGGVRTLEVVELSPLSGALIRTGTGTSELRLLLVTCRDVEGGDASPLVRLIVEAGQDHGPERSVAARVL